MGDGRHLLGSRGAELGRGEVGDLVSADGFEERLDAAVDQAAQAVVIDLDVGYAGRQADRSGRRGPGKGNRDAMDGRAVGHVSTLKLPVPLSLPSNYGGDA